MTTRHDMTAAIARTLKTTTCDFNIEAIADQVRAEFKTQDIEAVPITRYWEIVQENVKEEKLSDTCNCGHPDCGAY
jgi:hypothetical protein